jgi:GT2 family glycosyltransferase
MEEMQEGISNYFPCGGVIINRKIFETYGIFDSKLFAFEEYEFSIRAICSDFGAFKVYPLPEIELIHDHRFQQKKSDKKAVLERYNENRIQSSLQRVMDKHKIVFEHDWRWWTRKQVADMTGEPLIKRIKESVVRRLGFVFNR